MIASAEGLREGMVSQGSTPVAADSPVTEPLISRVESVTLRSPKGDARRQMGSMEHISLGINQYLRRLLYVGGNL